MKTKKTKYIHPKWKSVNQYKEFIHFVENTLDKFGKKFKKYDVEIKRDALELFGQIVCTTARIRNPSDILK